MLTPFIDSDVLAESPQVLAERLAADVADSLRSAIDQRGRATLVVSGGSTPKPFFHALSALALDWSSVCVTLADERWVDIDHDDSNERFVRQHLLVDAAAAATFLSLKNPHASAHEGVEQCESALAQLPWPVDVLVLGMGADGHTASLFPQSPGLDAALAADNPRRCVAIDPPGFPIGRMSLTLAALLDSRHLLLHITGERKREVLADGLENSDTLALPVLALMRSEHRPCVYWAPDA